MKELDLLKKIGKRVIILLIKYRKPRFIKWFIKNHLRLWSGFWLLAFWKFYCGLVWVFVLTQTVFKKENKEIITLLTVLNFNYGVVLAFFYVFYKIIAISTTVSTKQLMHDILKTEKQFSIMWYNLGMIVVYCVIAFTIAFVYNPEMIVLKDKIATNGKVMAITIVVLVLTILMFFRLFWLFYRILYGILMRLYSNYKELKKIDL
jgi:hypothetical protein